MTLPDWPLACTLTPAPPTSSPPDTCKPGFGLASSPYTIDLTNPSCGRCLTGTYSSGFVASGQKCDECPKTANFTGKMVSREGIFTPEDCYSEFPTMPEVFDNSEAWDVIPMAVGSTLIHQTYADSATCQTECAAAGSGCQVRAVQGTSGDMCIGTCVSGKMENAGGCAGVGLFAAAPDILASPNPLIPSPPPIPSTSCSTTRVAPSTAPPT